VGGGGPRFWFSVSPELQQLNYAQIIIQVEDKYTTAKLIEPLQRELSARIPGTRIDVRQLESGKAIGLPVAVRVSGSDIATLRGMSEELKAIFRSSLRAARVRDDWGDETFAVALQTDADRANLSGISNLDVALASAAGISGFPITVLREGDKQIPVAARLRMDERAGLEDLKNLYVYSSQGPQHLPLRQISTLSYSMQTEKLWRRNQFRTITVSCMPEGNYLPSEVMADIRPALQRFGDSLPPGYRMEIGGEEEARQEGFSDLLLVMLVSVLAIFLALVFQFKHAIKPLIVFAAVPFGIVGAIAALWVMGAPFGFMAFLGIISLMGVIVSNIIVLFDFVEEKRQEGAPFERALPGCRHHAAAAGHDYRGVHSDRAGAPCNERRAFMGTDVLCPDRRIEPGHDRHASAGSRDLFDICARPEDREVGAVETGNLMRTRVLHVVPMNMPLSCLPWR
jgi:multidrug efflux pump subunit AcrB